MIFWAVPLALVLAAGGVTTLGTGGFGATLGDLSAAALSTTAALGLVVADIEVEGRQTTDRETIIAALGAHAGSPILAVSPTHAREQLESLPWVRSAAIERRLPGTLYVRLTERKPLAVWQHDGNQELIDFDGAVIPVKDLSRFAKLPTVVGGDAARRGAAELIALLANEPDLAPRVTAAILVGERRWNLRIDNAIDVLLPEVDAAAAWTKLAQLERDNRLLQHDVQTIDLRLPDRLVLRVNDPGAKDAPGKKSHQVGKST
jgi:cell division protein FtsQ